MPRLGLLFVRRLWLNLEHLASLDRLLQRLLGHPNPLQRYLEQRVHLGRAPEGSTRSKKAADELKAHLRS